MDTITKTALNSPAVQKFYESRLSASSHHGPRRGRGGIQEGDGLLSLITGLATNVTRAVRAGQKLARRSRAIKKAKTNPPAASSQQPAKKTPPPRRRAQNQPKTQRRPAIKGRGKKRGPIRSQTGKGLRRPWRATAIRKRRTRPSKVTI